MRLSLINRNDKRRHEVAAVQRLRSISAGHDPLANADPDEVNRRLRNMSGGSSNSNRFAD